MSKIDWHFVPCGTGERSSFSDAGIVTFKGDTLKYLARESIQNSLDAKGEHKDKPVKVSFKRFQLNLNELPAIDTFKEISKLCEQFDIGDIDKPSSQSNSSHLFFSKLRKYFKDGKLDILEISDENTTGLRYEKDTKSKKSNEWFRLLFEKGKSTRRENIGGTYGIGRNAPFAASDFRTIFYSTKINKDTFHFGGKTILTSFEREDDVFLPTGHFGYKLSEKEPIAPISTLDDIPLFFQRKKVGTSIFILGFDYGDEWFQELLKATIENYYVAIHSNELEVSFKDTIKEKQESLSKGSLKKSIDKYDLETKYFYNALITKEDGSPFREELKYLGNCEFYVTKMPNAPREIDWMRKNHQVIERYTRKTALKEDYVGIFICSDPKGNELLATLEPPAHDKWDTTQAKDEKFTSLYGNNYGEKALSEIKNWTRNILKGLRREDLLEAGEFLDLSNFLPMDEEEILSGNLLKKNIKKAEFETAAERHTDATNKGTKAPPKKKKILKPLDEDNTSSDDSNELPGEDEPNTQGNDDNNNDNGNTNGSGSSNGKNEDPKDDKEQDSKNQKSGNFSEVYYRIFKLPTGDNTYRIKLSPSTDFKGNLSLSAKGEENSSENINISSIVNTTLSNIKHKDNRLLDIELKKDSKVSIDIEVDSHLKLALELKNE